MDSKKIKDQKCVHRFTKNALLKFRPINWQRTISPPHIQEGFVSQISSLFSNVIKAFSPRILISAQSPSAIQKNINCEINNQDGCKPSEGKGLMGGIFGETAMVTSSCRKVKLQSELDPDIGLNKNRASKMQQYSPLTFLQKISMDSFLIGNQNQLDMITISGIYQNTIDSDINWSLNIHKKIVKLSVEDKKCLLAIQSQKQILVYQYNSKNIKIQPVFLNKTKLIDEPRFLLFLKDYHLGVFYSKSVTVYLIDQHNPIRPVFNKKYGVQDQLQLYQVPKPMETTLNIFFKEKSSTMRTYVLWRLQFDFKQISAFTNFKSLLRIYDIPCDLMRQLKIDNYSKNIFMMNFKYEILAAKDGYIVDSVNINIQEDGSCLVYHGDHLLHVSKSKLFIYSFLITENGRSNKIDMKSIDSIDVQQDSKYLFFDCLEMLNGNYVLFYQIKPQYNHKLKGQIDYMITATEKLSIHDKLKEIFSFKSPTQLKEIAQNNFQKIQQKCDMAFKIGLTRKEVYLQLWNKSNKKDIQDYKFLLDTMDYQTIKLEVEKKLKKNSMSFNEVYKLQQGCFEMLKSDLLSHSKYDQNCIKNYLISHFLLRKLAFFRDIKLQNQNCLQDNKGFFIGIQEYFQCVKMELKSHFLDYAYKICFQQKDYTYQLRLFVRSFKFALRTIYPNILQDLIVQSKSKLMVFLKAIPQILPITSDEIPCDENRQMYLGLWSQIENQEWNKNLHIQQITTIYNRDLVHDFVKSVWFKRNQFILHDLIALPKGTIVQQQQCNHSEGIFYFFIQKVFKHSKDRSTLTKVIDFLELNYNQFPIYLKGRIFLYKQLYDYFKKEKCCGDNLQSFNIFLRLKDYQLFWELFKHQKIKKGCLLRDAKAIYNSLQNGNALYNEGLLNYFASGISEISDLKSILNRLNNEKKQFHLQNEGIYEVLVKGMEMKLRFGNDKDIPFDEVMIYFENIPLSKTNPVIEDLNIIQRIGEQSQRFKKMKLNMSFKQIMQQFEDVLIAMISHQIAEKNVLLIRDYQQLKNITYSILAEVQTVKERIYKDKLNDFAFFIYISKILEQKQMIQHASLLMRDVYLLEFYSINDKIIQILVIYMYRWKLTQQPLFIHSQDYLCELLTLLPGDNVEKTYLKAEVQFSIILSSPDCPVQFRSDEAPEPFLESNSKNDNLITIGYITELINNLQADFLVKLDIERLYELVKKMQEINYPQQLCIKRTSLVEIYEIVILRLIHLNSIRQAIPLLRKIIVLQGKDENYSIVFCFLILSVIINELADKHKRNMVKLVFYTFNNPLQLLDIIETRIQNTFSMEQQQSFIQRHLLIVKSNKCYNKSNFLFDELLMARVNQKQERHYLTLEDLIFQTWQHLNSNREDFSKSYEFTFIYICLLNNPYSLAKYLHINQENINIRTLRSYLSYVFKEEIFNGINVLYLGKRIFQMVLTSILESVTIQFVVRQYKGVGIDEDFVQICELQENNDFAIKLKKSIQRFSKKINSLNTNTREPTPQEEILKKARIETLLKKQVSIQDDPPSEYPFNDSDDNYEEEQREEISMVVSSPLKQKTKNRVFNAAKQRKILFDRVNSNSLFVYAGVGQSFEIRRSSPSFLKTANNYNHAFKSLRFGQARHQNVAESSIGNNSVSEQFQIEKVGQPDSKLKVDYQKQDLGSSQAQGMFASLTPVDFPTSHQTNKKGNKTYPKSDISEKKKNPQQVHSPVKLMNQNSIMNLEDVGNLQQSFELDEGAFTVNIKQIDDNTFTPVRVVTKKLLEDCGDDLAQPMFNLSVISDEENKEFEGFDAYLKILIGSVYQSQEKPLSFILVLIKAIKNMYPRIKMSTEFLDIYILLESYNTKYRYALPLRGMFPINGIFLESKDPKDLFNFAKEHILEYVDFNNVLIVAKLIHFALKKSQIKDQLYFAYLTGAIKSYSNDTIAEEKQLINQKQRISGIIDQIIMVNLFVDRGHTLLAPLQNEGRKHQIIALIKESLSKKKKYDIIIEFESRIAKK